LKIVLATEVRSLSVVCGVIPDDLGYRKGEPSHED